MKISVSLLVATTLVDSTLAVNWFGNSVVNNCKRGKTSLVRSADCDVLGRKGMVKCLAVTKHDRTVAAVIRRCHEKLPKGNGFNEAVERAYLNKMPRTFRALISQGRCSKLSSNKLESLLSSFVNNNSVPFVRAIVRHCVIGSTAYQQFMQQARVQGKSELIVVFQSTPRSSSVEQAGHVHGKPITSLNTGKSNHHSSYSCQKIVRVTNDGRQVVTNTCNNGNNRIAGSAQQGSYHGNPIQVSIEEVTSNLSILTQLRPEMARKFGLLTDACMGLTETHFKQPGVSTQVVASLPLACFQKLPPQAFGGLNASMIGAIRWWPFVTRDQIKYIQTGDAVRALPFDQLGPGRQRDREDKVHPCWTITRDQLRSIRKSSRVKREYDRRCIRSAAPSLTVSATLLVLATTIAFTAVNILL